MVLDLNLLCSWAWNQIFILVEDTTGYLSVGLWFLQYLIGFFPLTLTRNLSVGLWFLQYLIGFFPLTLTRNLSPFLHLPGSLLSTKKVEQVSFISLHPPFNS